MPGALIAAETQRFALVDPKGIRPRNRECPLLAMNRLARLSLRTERIVRLADLPSAAGRSASGKWQVWAKADLPLGRREFPGLTLSGHLRFHEYFPILPTAMRSSYL